MQFLILGFDGEDEKALDRRLAVRDKHIELSDKAIQRKEQLVGAAMLDDHGKMVGSAMIVDFPSREDVDKWLKKEPYMQGEVWKKVQIIPCKIGPSFEHLFK